METRMSAGDEVSSSARNEGEAVAWQKWTATNSPPINGDWFVARAPVGDCWQVRVVHYADKFDRLPIDHSGNMWSAEPTEWLSLHQFSKAHPIQGEAEMREKVADLIVGKAVIDVDRVTCIGMVANAEEVADAILASLKSGGE